MGKAKKEEEVVFLRKKITLLRAFSLLIGTMVGSGIFISPKGVLKNSGNVGLSLVVWLACGILSLFGELLLLILLCEPATTLQHSEHVCVCSRAV